MNDQNPRQIAARILSQRQNSNEFTENLLEIALATARLSPADRGLCHELVCGVVRWQATLDCLIARKTTAGREQRPALKNLLRLGLYQIFWLDRIPPHAALSFKSDTALRISATTLTRALRPFALRKSASSRSCKEVSCA